MGRHVVKRPTVTAERGEWLEAELTGCSFPDSRLDDRLRKLLEGMAGALGESLPTVCQDWVSEDAILDGHFQATAERVAACSGPVLVLHDTTEFCYKRGDPEKIGLIGKVADYRVCGLSELCGKVGDGDLRGGDVSWRC